MPEVPIRLLHVISGLGTGGAEFSLLKLLANLDRDRFPAEVVSLTSDAPLGERLRSLGIPVTALHLLPGRPDPRLIFHLASHIRRFQPDIIQTWMYHADLIGGLAGRLTGCRSVVWNIRHTVISMKTFKPTTRLVVRLNGVLSHLLPVRIVCNAEAGRQSHARLGYDFKRMVVIPNGFDLDAFRPDPATRIHLRTALGLPKNTLLIGMAARFHQLKDHPNFIQAAAILHAQMPAVHFALWGKDVDARNALLTGWIEQAGLREHIHLLGLRSDVAKLTAAMDLATLSSQGEAFPGVVGEAMACQVPCAVTDVGDAALIVGDTGRVVPPRDPRALADAWQVLLTLPPGERAALGRKARLRILAHFDLKHTSSKYALLYQDIMTGRIK